MSPIFVVAHKTNLQRVAPVLPVVWTPSQRAVRVQVRVPNPIQPPAVKRLLTRALQARVLPHLLRPRLRVLQAHLQRPVLELVYNRRYNADCNFFNDKLPLQALYHAL